MDSSGSRGGRIAFAVLAVAVLAGAVALAGRPDAAAADCPPEEAGGGPGYGADGQFDAGLEELVMAQADALGDRFAGAEWHADGTVTFRITGGTAPKELRDHPNVRIVTARFGADRLDEAMDKAADRLNTLLAPDGEPMANGAWPWDGSVDLDRNVVALRIDPSQRPKHAAIRAVLTDELTHGTVTMCYGAVPIVRPL